MHAHVHMVPTSLVVQSNVQEAVRQIHHWLKYGPSNHKEMQGNTEDGKADRAIRAYLYPEEWTLRSRSLYCAF
jgi:hypothetical protein